MGKDIEEPAGGRLLLLTSLIAVATTATVGFGRVFRGHLPTLKLCLAGAAAILLAWALERRHVALAVLGTVIGLAVTIGLAVFPGTTWYGLPTLDTLRAGLDALDRVGNTAQAQVAPTPPLVALFLPALVAVWSAGFALHSMVVRARSPFLGLLPPAALLAFANIVVEDGVRPAYVLAFLAAALILLFADSLRRVAHWGPVTSWRTPFQPRTDSLAARLRSSLRIGAFATGRPARRVATAALAATLAGAWVLPGFRSAGLVSFSGEVSPLHVSIDPIVEIRPALLNRQPVELFTVESLHPSYWRFLSLDQFDGERWTSSNPDAAGGDTVRGGGVIAATHIDVDRAGLATRLLEQEITVQKLRQPWLPAAYTPIGISVTRSEVRYDATGDVLFADEGTYPGFSYKVMSSLTVPSPGAIAAEPLPDRSVVEAYTRLPATPPAIVRLAHRLTDDEPTVYGKVLAIQNYLRENFRYDLRVPAGHDSNHILRFLTQTKAGYCEQFAGSMAVLLRAIGIPTRVAVGFTPGRFDPKANLWRVTLQNAHAWVEVFFPSFGWLSFEPTPSRTNPTAETYDEPLPGTVANVFGCPGLTLEECQAQVGGVQGNGQNRTSENSSDRPRLGSDLAEGIPPPSAGTLPPLQLAPPAEEPSWIPRAVVAALILLAVLALGVPLWKGARRRLRLARARQPAERVLVAFDVMTQEAADLGFARRSNETLLEYQTRLRQRVSALDGDLDRLTALTTVAAYADRAVGDADADAAITSARRVTGDLRKAAGPARRIAGRYRFNRMPPAF
ncbi:MAG: transglutaminaseTgpA domain-containing protein [Actinomycetota bacterium]